nr:hypothetical protein [Tanacetum cinerariifolium]
AFLAKTTPTHSTTSPVTVPTPQSFGDSQGQWYHDKALLMQAKEKGVVLDAEAKAFLANVEYTAPYNQPLALTTTNLFEANHEDPYDSDVDEGPHASAAFMANLSSTGGINGLSSSHINEVQISDDSFFSDVSYLLSQEMQQEEHLNSKVDSMLDDNIITCDEYQNDSGVEAVPTVVSAEEAIYDSPELEWCMTEMQALERNKVKHDLDMAIVERNNRNAELEEENAMLKSTLKSKVVSIENLQQESKQVKEFERIFDKLDTEYEWILLEKKNMQIEKKNLMITNECLIANSIANDICSIALAYDLVVPPSSDSSHYMLEELRTTCNREHSKVLKLEADILKKQVTF